MINPTTIKKTSGKGEHSHFLDISYNGKKLGRLGLYNVFTSAGVQGFRMVWQEEGKGWDSKTQGVVYEYTDRDAQGNIKHTK